MMAIKTLSLSTKCLLSSLVRIPDTFPIKHWTLTLIRKKMGRFSDLRGPEFMRTHQVARSHLKELLTTTRLRLSHRLMTARNCWLIDKRSKKRSRKKLTTKNSKVHRPTMLWNHLWVAKYSSSQRALERNRSFTRTSRRAALMKWWAILRVTIILRMEGWTVRVWGLKLSYCMHRNRKITR